MACRSRSTSSNLFEFPSSRVNRFRKSLKILYQLLAGLESELITSSTVQNRFSTLQLRGEQWKQKADC